MKNSGVIKLKNSKMYPFNNSITAVALKVPFESSNYNVYAVVQKSTGEVGDIVISDKARNGFKIAYTGSAVDAEISWSAEVCDQ